MSTIKVGQVVRFKFGKQPISQYHKDMAARRGRSMAECRQIDIENASIVWEDLYTTDRVFKVDGEFVWVGDVRDGGYRLKASDVEVV